MSHDHANDEDPCAGASTQVPEGAAVFPVIPEELGIHPMLLAVLHAIVFFDGSSEDVVHDAAADEALNYLVSYLQRLKGPDLQRLKEDLDCLIAYAKEQEWPKEEITFLKGFLTEYGIGLHEDRKKNLV